MNILGMTSRFGLVLSTTVALACGGSSSQNDDGASDGATSTAGDDDGTPTGADGGPGPTGGVEDTGGTGTPSDTGDTGMSDDTGTTGGIPDDAEIWELRADGFSPIVPLETFYSCFSFNIPVDQLHHIIGFVPQVTNPVIHHYVLSVSPTPTNHEPNIPCIEWPDQIIWAWAPGMPAMYLPDNAGFLAGQTGDTVNFILQVHYNNPLLQEFEDNDGIDVVVTKTLREHRAGIFSQGDIGAINIPPGQAAYQHTATCDPAETASLLSEPINVFASFLHAHEIGAAIRSDVYRDGGLVGTIAEEDPFDFNFQKFLDADVEIQPGDSIETVCTYDSTERTNTTPGGVASDEEMCINFMMYYPWVDAETCGSL